MKYLDPKADLTFKKVFGEHPDLVMSLLNSLLPFEREDQMIRHVEYLQAEQVPNTPFKKDSIVDVKCSDGGGRVFIVEMQMYWSEIFRQRVLFNASKALVKQLDRGGDYNQLQPVYSLNLVNDIFEPKLEEYLHNYQVSDVDHPDHIIEGMHITFVELPKFKPSNWGERKMQVLWLRFLTEINERTTAVPEELLENEDIRKALTLVEESAFTPEQMEGYDHFWDVVSTEKSIVTSAVKEGIKTGITQGLQQGRIEGMAQGRIEGMAQGRKEGMAQGRTETLRDNIVNLRQFGMTNAQIAQALKLDESVVSGI